MNAFLCIDFSQIKESRNQDNWDNLPFFSFDIKYTEIKTLSLISNRGLFINVKTWGKLCKKIQ